MSTTGLLFDKIPPQFMETSNLKRFPGVHIYAFFKGVQSTFGEALPKRITELLGEKKLPITATWEEHLDEMRSAKSSFYDRQIVPIEERFADFLRHITWVVGLERQSRQHQACSELMLLYALGQGASEQHHHKIVTTFANKYLALSKYDRWTEGVNPLVTNIQMNLLINIQEPANGIRERAYSGTQTPFQLQGLQRKLTAQIEGRGLSEDEVRSVIEQSVAELPEPRVEDQSKYVRKRQQDAADTILSYWTTIFDITERVFKTHKKPEDRDEIAAILFEGYKNAKNVQDITEYLQERVNDVTF